MLTSTVAGSPPKAVSRYKKKQTATLLLTNRSDEREQLAVLNRQIPI